MSSTSFKYVEFFRFYPESDIVRSVSARLVRTKSNVDDNNDVIRYYCAQRKLFEKKNSNSVPRACRVKRFFIFQTLPPHRKMEVRHSTAGMYQLVYVKIIQLIRPVKTQKYTFNDNIFFIILAI